MEPVASPVLDGLLEGLILHALEREPSHGYGILKDLESAIGEAPSKNRIYRVLRELEDEGLLDSEETTEDSRTRQVYSLTSRGADRLEEYRDLPAPFKNRIAGLFGIRPSAEPAERDEPEPPRDESETQADRPAERGWVQARLDELPTDAPVRAPHARFSLDRSPGESAWQLTVERHEPGDYEGSEDCSLTFVYLAIQQLLYGARP